tara:strand:+ start:1136 stop:1405 length:270 start_codon:yes stop_codon:yes gene_type:complete
MSLKYGNLIAKKDNYNFSVKLNVTDSEDWFEVQRPLIENVVTFINDRQMVDNGVTIKINWNEQDDRLYNMKFESIDDARLFEITFAEYF